MFWTKLNNFQQTETFWNKSVIFTDGFDYVDEFQYIVLSYKDDYKQLGVRDKVLIYYDFFSEIFWIIFALVIIVLMSLGVFINGPILKDPIMVLHIFAYPANTHIETEAVVPFDLIIHAVHSHGFDYYIGYFWQLFMLKYGLTFGEDDTSLVYMSNLRQYASTASMDNSDVRRALSFHETHDYMNETFSKYSITNILFFPYYVTYNERGGVYWDKFDPEYYGHNYKFIDRRDQQWYTFRWWIY